MFSGKQILVKAVLILAIICVLCLDTHAIDNTDNKTFHEPERFNLYNSHKIFTDSVVNEITKLCENQDFNNSLWVKDLETGEQFIYNPDQSYYSASIIKAPYAIWLCTQADRGIIDISGEIQNYYSLCAKSKWVGQYKDDSTINTWTCIDAMIYASDNPSTALLSRIWPVTYGDEFNDFLHNTLDWEKESKGEVDRDVTNGYLTVIDAAKTLEYLYEYFNENETNGPRLKNSFISANHNHLWVPDDCEVAKKFGSWTDAFHDIAIVYSEHPYMIACMTDAGIIGQYDKDAKQFMVDIGQLIYNITQNNRVKVSDYRYSKTVIDKISNNRIREYTYKNLLIKQQ